MPSAPTPPIKDILISSQDPELVEILKEIKQTLDIREGRLGDTNFRFIDYYELIALLAGDEIITITVLPGAHSHPHNDLTTIQGGAATEYYHLTLAEHTALGAIPTKIEQLNTKVEVIDAGTGQIDFNADGTDIGQLTAAVQRLGITTDSYISINQASNQIEFYMGGQRRGYWQSGGAGLIIEDGWLRAYEGFQAYDNQATNSDVFFQSYAGGWKFGVNSGPTLTYWGATGSGQLDFTGGHAFRMGAHGNLIGLSSGGFPSLYYQNTEELRVENGNITINALRFGIPGAGATVDTIETTLTNDDTHIPTSGAVFDWVAAYLHDKIGEGNSSVEVIDTGTGQVDVTVDTALVMRFLTDRAQIPGGLLETDTGTPIDLTVDCGTDKTIALADTVWDDVKVTPGAFQFSGSGDPSLIDWQPSASGATFKIWAFAKNDQVYAVVQMPHKYKEGTDLEFHIHWTPHNRGVAESAKTVGWKVDYSIANINGTFPASSTADLSDTVTGTDDKHEITSAVVVSGTGLTISHMIMLRIYRSDTGVDDTWAGVTAAQSPALLEFDIHFEIDTMGSRQNFIK
jgi:hypothetical protein